MSFPAIGYLNNAARTEGEMKTAFEDLNKAARQIPGAGVADQALTIASGSVTPALGSSNILVVDTEASAAIDDLTNIVLTNIDDGALVYVRNANAARVVVAKHSAGGSGQLSLSTGGDFVLADPDRHWLLLKRNGTLFLEVARFPSADLAPLLSKSANYTTTPADRARFIDCTATLTLTLLAAATAGKGYEQVVQCSGGTVTIDPNGAETIGGASTLLLQRGDVVRLVCDGTAWQIIARYSAQVGPMHGHLWGLTLSNNGTDPTNDLDVAVGEAISDDTNSADAVLMRLTSALTKRIDATWTVGNNGGLLASGAALANGTYHIFLIMRPDTGVVDLAADSSVTGANLAANTNAAYTKKRRILSVLREAGALVRFVQDGDHVSRKTAVLDISAANPGTAAVTRTLSVPVGLRVFAEIAVNYRTDGQEAGVYISDLSVDDQAPSTTAAPLLSTGAVSAAATVLISNAGPLIVATNTSAQVRSRASISSAAMTLYVATLGWVDMRGRLS